MANVPTLPLLHPLGEATVARTSVRPCSTGRLVGCPGPRRNATTQKGQRRRSASGCGWPRPR